MRASERSAGAQKVPALAFRSMFLPGFVLSSCAEAPRLVPFNEAEFARYQGAGTGVVTGRAFMVLRDKTIRAAGKTAIDLEPVTRYTTETRDRKWMNGEKLAPPDSRLSNYIQEVVSDDNGYFMFTHVAPGEYYVVCHALWREELSSADSDQPWMDHWQWIFARASVRNGAKVNIADWAQGHFIVH
jgi:methyl coenzyme M reductase gamma subunit